MKKNISYDIDKRLINHIKSLNEGKSLKKIYINESDGSKSAIAITDDSKFGDNVLTNQIDAFRQAVNGSAKFAKENTEDAQSNPLVYFPNTGNLIFTGSIPSLSDLKFQFSLNDVTGSPYIFVNGLALTEEVITTINKIRGYYLNWRQEWQVETDLLDSLKKMK